MKRTFVTILITVMVTSFCWYFATGLRRSVERLWLMSAVKAPGRMALGEIEADLLGGRSDVAKAKIAALKKQWDVFESEEGFSGQAIGNIMVTFAQIDDAAGATKKPTSVKSIDR